MILDFEETKKLLRKYRIPFTKTEKISSKKEALKKADQLGYPLVLKVFSPNIYHRTEKELVRNNLKEREELKRAFLSLKKKTPEKGVLLLEKKEEGIELMAGMKRDPVFGPVVIFGLGGVFVEILKDISFALSPLSRENAKKAIKNIKGYKILRGYRNNPPVDLNKLADFLIKVSKLAEENPKIKEIDFNPIFAKGGRIKAVDFKIIC